MTVPHNFYIESIGVFFFTKNASELNNTTVAETTTVS